VILIKNRLIYHATLFSGIDGVFLDHVVKILAEIIQHRKYFYNFVIRKLNGCFIVLLSTIK